MKLNVIRLTIALLAVFCTKTVMGSVKCPYPCRCNKTTILCVERDLEYIPKFKIKPHVDLIDLSMNDIEEIREDSFNFPGASQVVQLYMQGNSITDLEPLSFLHLINLEVLDLHDNLIGFVPPEMIRANKRLLLLNLSENLFVRRTPALQSDSLETLDLSKTRISTFYKHHIEGLPKLRKLYLYSNNLVRLDSSIFVSQQNFALVELTHNIWECDCNTTNLFDALIAKGLVTKQTIQCKRDEEYFDIYTESGPVYSENTCSNHKTMENSRQVNKLQHENSKNDSTNILRNYTSSSHHLHHECIDLLCNPVNFILLIAASFISVIVILGIILMFVLLRKAKKDKTYEMIAVYEMTHTLC